MKHNVHLAQKEKSKHASRYEAMARETFTSDYLKRETPDERKKAYLKWHTDFGSMKFGQMERHGAKAPLRISFTGSRTSGVMWLDLDPSSRIGGVRIEAASTNQGSP